MKPVNLFIHFKFSKPLNEAAQSPEKFITEKLLVF